MEALLLKKAAKAPMPTGKCSNPFAFDEEMLLDVSVTILCLLPPYVY